MPLGRNQTHVINSCALGGRFPLPLLLLVLVWFGCDAPAAVFAGLLPAITQTFAELSNLKLLQLCAQHPERAGLWQEFTRRFQAQLRAWALQALRTFEQKEIAHYREAVDDVVQDVYLRLVQYDCHALHAFKGNTDDEWFGYLRTITHNVALNRIRQNTAQKRPRLTHSLDEGFDDAAEGHASRPHPKFVAQATDEATQVYELHEHINYYLDAVLRGPQKHRDKMLFQLCYFEGLSLEEIEKTPGLNLSRHALEVAINRVCHRLAKHAKQLQP